MLPTPAEQRLHRSAGMALRAGLRVVVGPDPDVVAAGVLLAEQLGLLLGGPVAVEQPPAVPGGPLRLVVTELPLQVLERAAEPVLDAAADPVLRAQAYRLTVRSGRADVVADAVPGLHHGVAALVQLTRHAVARQLDPGGTPVLPAATVEDRPALEWRGLALDAVALQLAPETLLPLLDLLGVLRIDVLRVRLSDDRSWLLEVPGRPELTDPGVTGGRHRPLWTDASWRELQAYARSRGVAVVPEVDVAAHTGWAGPEVFGTLAAGTLSAVVHLGGLSGPCPDEVLTGRVLELAASEVRAAGARVMVREDAVGALRPPLHEGLLVEVGDPDLLTAATRRAVEAGAGLVVVPSTLRLGRDPRVVGEVLDVGTGTAAARPRRLRGVEAVLAARPVELEALLPALAALAEVTWGHGPRRTAEELLQRVEHVRPALLGPGPAWHAEAG